MSFFGILRAFTDATYNALRQDKSTHALITIDYAHHEIHGGSEFRAGGTKEIAGSGTMEICFTTPNTTKWMHFLLAVDVHSEARVQLQEGITSFTGGTAITPRNANRNSIKTSGVTDMALDPTTTPGTPTGLGDQYIGQAGANLFQQSLAGSGETRNEWVLKQNTKYRVLVTNQDTNPNRVNIKMSWYEHTDKENPF